jgi:hypothetical protein
MMDGGLVFGVGVVVAADGAAAQVARPGLATAFIAALAVAAAFRLGPLSGAGRREEPAPTPPGKVISGRAFGWQEV